MANKSIFLTIDVETGKAVKSVSDIRKIIKEMTDDLVRLKAQGKGVGDADFDKLEAKIKSAKKELQSFQDRLKETPTFTQKIQKGFEDSFLKIGGAIAGAFAISKVIEFGQASISVAREVERNETLLLNALNGRKAVQQQLIQQANELEQSTGIDDREIIKQQTFLALQGRTQSEISKTIEAAIRLSKVTGEDLGSAVEKLDATFEGNVGKLGKLDEGFKNLTEAQLKSGAAIELINSKYADTLELQTEADKAANSFSNAIEDLEKNFGNLLIKLAPVASGLAGIIGELNKLGTSNFQNLLDENTKKTSGAIENALKDFSASRDAYIKTGVSAEKAITEATNDEINARYALIRGLDAKKDTEQIIILSKQIDALKQNQIAELNAVKAGEQAKNAEKDKAAKEDEKRRKEAFEKYKSSLDSELKALQDRNKIEDIQSGGPGSESRLNSEKQNLIEEQKLIEDQLKLFGDKRTKQEEELYNALLLKKSEYSDKIFSKDKEIYTKQLEDAKLATQALIEQTQAGSEERLQTELAGLEKQREIIKKSNVLNPNEKVIAEADVQKRINDVYVKFYTSRLNIEKKSLEDRKSTLEKDLENAKGNKKKEEAIQQELNLVKIQLEQSYVNFKLNILTQLQAAGVQLSTEELADYKNFLEKKKQLDQAYANAVTTTSNTGGLSDEDQNKILQASLNAASELFASAIQTQIDLSRQQTEARLNDINTQLDAELAAIDEREARERGTFVERDAIAKKYDAARKAARDKAAAEEAKVKTEQAKKDKEYAIISATIRGALAVVSAFTAIPFSLANAIAVSIATAAQIATIAAQPIPKFNKGGIIVGKSHAEGGIPAIVGGSTPIELEGGEAIITKNAVADPRKRAILSAINSSSGGVSFAQGGIPIYNRTSTFEQGGVSTRLMQSDLNINNNIDLSELKSFLDAKLNQPIRSYVVESEITQSQTLNRTIENRSKI